MELLKTGSVPSVALLSGRTDRSPKINFTDPSRNMRTIILRGVSVPAFGPVRRDRSKIKKSMNSIKYIIPVAVLGLFLCATTKAKEKEVQFTTVPEVVRTTVFHKYHITSPEKVVRVVEEPDNVYELTVLTDSGQQIVYVNADGTIVERPGGVVETTKGESESGEVTVTLDQVQNAGERYEFVQDQGPDAIFIDHQTNKRVIVKGGAGHGGRGGVRTKEGSQTDVRSNEKSQTDVRTNEENKGGVRTEERDQQSGNMREKTDQGNSDQGQKNMRNEQRNADQDQKNMKEGEKTQDRSSQGEQRDQGNRETTAPGNGRQEDKNASERNMNGEQQGQKQQRESTRTPGEKQSQENSKGKGKASPTP